MTLSHVWYSEDDQFGQAPWQPIDQAITERSETGSRASEKSTNYWRTELAKVPSPMFPANSEPPAEPRICRLAVDSPALAAAGLKLAQELGVNTGAILLGAVCAMLGDFTGNSTIALQVIVSNRFEKRTRSMVGLMNQDGIMTLSLTGEPFRAIVRSALAASMRAYMGGHYDPALAEQVRAEAARRQGVERIDASAYFNNFPYPGPGSWETSVPQGLSKGEVVALRRRSTFRMVSSWPRQDSTLFIHSYYNPGTVTVHAVADTVLFPVSAARAFVRGIEDLVVEAAFGDPGPEEIARIGASARDLEATQWTPLTPYALATSPASSRAGHEREEE
jgi:Condensation domain